MRLKYRGKVIKLGSRQVNLVADTNNGLGFATQLSFLSKPMPNKRTRQKALAVLPGNTNKPNTMQPLALVINSRQTV
jgi:hypothetical protein